MKKVYTIFFIFTAIFLVVQLLIYLGTDLPDWIRFYLKDFLVMPIVLTICLFGVQKIKRDPSIRLSMFTCFSLATLYALYFELYLPRVTERYTADLLDMLLYFAGALLFYFLQDPRPGPGPVMKRE